MVLGLVFFVLLSTLVVRGEGPLRDACVEEFHDVQLDHFGPYADADGEVLRLRFFLCKPNRRETAAETDLPRRSLFVYFGNEADVELYLNNTGLMWENAGEFHADLLFIEHRFYGKSTPELGLTDALSLKYLSTEQALADFAQVIDFVQRREYGAPRAVPAIGFGGSYGGMLGVFFKYKYGASIDGVIAASAPIFTYVDEDYDEYGFARIVTEDARKASLECVETARASWEAMLETPPSELGRLAGQLRWCNPAALETKEDVRRAVDWLSSAWDMLAMGNYPWPSSYITGNEASPLPAWPVRAACDRLLARRGHGDKEEDEEDEEKEEEEEENIIDAMVAAVGVFHNASGVVECYSDPDGFDGLDGLWDYQYCVGDGFMPMGRNGKTDMFYDSAFSLIDETARCNATWGVVPDLSRGIVAFGGREILHHIENVVFSNGDLDPWTSGGVLPEHIPHHLRRERDLSAVFIEGGAHHLDLFFSHDDDPTSVVDARTHERGKIRKWIDEFYSDALVGDISASVYIEH